MWHQTFTNTIIKNGCQPGNQNLRKITSLAASHLLPILLPTNSWGGVGPFGQGVHFLVLQLEVHIFCIFCIMQKMPKQKIFRKKWMQKNAIKENHDFSLILAKYSLILQKIRLHRKYFLSNIETRLILHTITPLKHLKK